jgi:hypothetical protein
MTDSLSDFDRQIELRRRAFRELLDHFAQFEPTDAFHVSEILATIREKGGLDILQTDERDATY